MYDFPLAGRPTMTITSLAATSRWGILPSGETLDRVMPGMLRVVACGRTRGVWLPEFCRTGGMRGELGAVDVTLRAYVGVSVKSFIARRATAKEEGWL